MSKLTIDGVSGGSQELVQVILPDGPEFPLPEWERTLLVMQGGEVLVSAGLVSMEYKEFFREVRQKQVPYVVLQNHLYFPTWWVARKKPEFAPVCVVLEQKARESMELELRRKQ